MTKTSAEQVIQQIKWFLHNKLCMPTPNQELLIIATPQDLAQAFQTRKKDRDILPHEHQEHTVTLTKLFTMCHPYGNKTPSPHTKTACLERRQLKSVATIKH